MHSLLSFLALWGSNFPNENPHFISLGRPALHATPEELPFRNPTGLPNLTEASSQRLIRTDPKSLQELAKLQGTWLVQKWAKDESRKKPFRELPFGDPRARRMTIEDDKLTLSFQGWTWLYRIQSIGNGKLNLVPESGDSKGHTFHGIYAVEKDELKLTWLLFGPESRFFEDLPVKRPTDFRSLRDENWANVVYILQREVKEDPKVTEVWKQLEGRWNYVEQFDDGQSNRLTRYKFHTEFDRYGTTWFEIQTGEKQSAGVRYEIVDPTSDPIQINEVRPPYQGEGEGARDARRYCPGLLRIRGDTLEIAVSKDPRKRLTSFDMPANKPSNFRIQVYERVKPMPPQKK